MKRLADVFEQRDAAAQDDRVHDQPVFVDEVLLDQRGGQVGAAEDEQVSARLLFEL
jgi:hypothetical protein